MKKLLLAFFAFCLVFTSAQSQCPSMAFDDFESGAMSPNWTLGSGYTRAVIAGNSPQGTYHLEQTGTSGHHAGMKWTFAASTPTYVGYYVYAGAATAAHNYVTVGDANTASNNGIMFMYNTGINTLRFYNGGLNYEAPIVQGNWYHVELVNINYTSKTFDIYINGVIAQANYPFRSTASVNINQVNLYNIASAGPGYYDEIVVGSVPLSLSTSIVNQACFGDSSGSVTASILSGVAPISYVWSTGDTSASISGLPAGAYTLSAVSGNGCTFVDTLVVSEPAAFSGTANSIAPLCSYSNDGELDYALTGGTPSYNYLWNTGDTTNLLTGLGAGTYYVDFSDSNGCTGSDTLILTAPSSLSFNDSIFGVGCNGDSTGMIDLSTTGGTMPYSFLWNSGEMTEDLSNLVAGTYSVQVTDTNACMHADTFVVMQPAALMTGGTVSPDFGQNQGAIDLTVTGGVGPMSFSWSNGATTEDLTNIAAGTYTVTITDANGCMTADSFTVDLLISIGSEKVEGLSVWPNPFANQIKVSVPSSINGVSMKLYNLNGALVMEKSISAGASQTSSIETSDLPNGVYFLRIIGDNFIENVKVTKQD